MESRVFFLLEQLINADQLAVQLYLSLTPVQPGFKLLQGEWFLKKLVIFPKSMGAVFLPYIAVIFANNPDPVDVTGIEDPQRQLEAPRPEPAALDDKPSVIIIRESPRRDDAS